MSTQSAAVESLNLARVFNADRERVFRAWTDPEILKQWFGPESCQVREVSLNLEVGERFHITFDNQEMGEIKLTGTYREIRAPEKLVFTWSWLTAPMDAIGETVVTVEFLERDGKTEVRVRHDGFPSDEARSNHDEGWNGCFVCLERQLER